MYRPLHAGAACTVLACILLLGACTETPPPAAFDCQPLPHLYTALPGATEAHVKAQAQLQCPALFYAMLQNLGHGVIDGYTYIFQDTHDPTNYASVPVQLHEASAPELAPATVGSLDALSLASSLETSRMPMLQDISADVTFARAEEIAGQSALSSCLALPRTRVHALSQLKEADEPSWDADGDSDVEDVHYYVGIRTGKIQLASRQVFQTACLDWSFPFKSSFCCDCLQHNPLCKSGDVTVQGA